MTNILLLAFLAFHATRDQILVERNKPAPWFVGCKLFFEKARRSVGIGNPRCNLNHVTELFGCPWWGRFDLEMRFEEMELDLGDEGVDKAFVEGREI